MSNIPLLLANSKNDGGNGAGKHTDGDQAGWDTVASGITGVTGLLGSIVGLGDLGGCLVVEHNLGCKVLRKNCDGDTRHKGLGCNLLARGKGALGALGNLGTLLDEVAHKAGLGQNKERIHGGADTGCHPHSGESKEVEV